MLMLALFAFNTEDSCVFFLQLLNPASANFDASAVSDIGVVKPIYKKPEARSKVSCHWYYTTLKKQTAFSENFSFGSFGFCFSICHFNFSGNCKKSLPCLVLVL
jgi:hypothetical protein